MDFRYFVNNKWSLVKIWRQFLQQSSELSYLKTELEDILSNSRTNLYELFYWYYYQWVFHRILKDNYEFISKYINSFVQQDQSIQLYIQNTFCIAKANQHQSLEKRIFNELVREWILKIQQIMRDNENYNSFKVVILVKMVYRIMRK